MDKLPIKTKGYHKILLFIFWLPWQPFRNLARDFFFFVEEDLTLRFNQIYEFNPWPLRSKHRLRILWSKSVREKWKISNYPKQQQITSRSHNPVFSKNLKEYEQSWQFYSRWPKDSVLKTQYFCAWTLNQRHLTI